MLVLLPLLLQAPSPTTPPDPPPEGETAEWLNSALAAVWPGLEAPAWRALLPLIGPALADHLPGAALTALNLGQTPPRLSRLRADRAGRDRLAVTAQLDWRGEAVLQVVVIITSVVLYHAAG